LFSIGLLHRVAGDFRPLSENRRQVSDVTEDRMSRIGQRSLMISHHKFILSSDNAKICTHTTNVQLSGVTETTTYAK